MRQVWTVLVQTFSRARFRLALIVLLSALLWSALFWLFADGFRFLEKSIPSPDLHDETVRAVFGMFFVALFAMLVFSSGIILYSSLFRAPDVSLLLSLPVRVQRIFLHKFQEAILLSSWAFVLLGSPMLLAYGIVSGAPGHYFLLLIPFLISFTYVPSGMGAILCLLIVHRLPSGRALTVTVAAVLGTLGAALIAWTVSAYPSSDLLTPGWFQEMLGRMEFAQHRLLPSWWLSSGLLESSAGELAESVLFLSLMIANALFLKQLAIWTAGALYRPAYDRIRGRRSGGGHGWTSWLDRAVFRCTRLLPAQMRLFIVKDLRLFRRDPVQWSQFLIFVGLLALYFLNIRRFRYDTYYAGWVNMVSFLNVSVVGLLLSTFTTRFIFPMVSLEGRRFWVLGLLPVPRERILMSKFAFAVGGSIIPCSALILLSDLMLRVRPLVVASHQLTCLILCFGLAGIAVGLGAKMPSLREESPSKIAAGFGGTLNLVVSTLYIVAVVLLTAVPCHFYFGAGSASFVRFLSPRGSLEWWLQFWFLAGIAGSLVLGTLATVIPLRIGFRAFRRLEF
jgi:ABC-2 type transport system permease protein